MLLVCGPVEDSRQLKLAAEKGKGRVQDSRFFSAIGGSFGKTFNRLRASPLAPVLSKSLFEQDDYVKGKDTWLCYLEDTFPSPLTIIEVLRCAGDVAFPLNCFLLHHIKGPSIKIP